MSPTIGVPVSRRPALEAVLGALEPASRIVLTTHVNADGDGAGSQAAMAVWLTGAGKIPVIINPTPFPDLYRHLLPASDLEIPLGDPRAARALADADLFLVLDTAEPGRLGRLPRHFRDRPVVVLDHHPTSETVISGTVFQDITACATGELVYDLMQMALGPDATWPDGIVQGIYTAIVTDTGSFRFANTNARTHLMAADLLRRGVDPEAAYRRLFATVPLRRIEILREALGTLQVDPDVPLTWITIPPHVTKSLSPTAEDVEGIVEYARAIEGTEVAILFRETGSGDTKVSFRSSSDADVNALARQFGGGGHAKASGAVLAAPLDEAQRTVLDAARELLRSTGAHREPA